MVQVCQGQEIVGGGHISSTLVSTGESPKLWVQGFKDVTRNLLVVPTVYVGWALLSLAYTLLYITLPNLLATAKHAIRSREEIESVVKELGVSKQYQKLPRHLALTMPDGDGKDVLNLKVRNICKSSLASILMILLYYFRNLVKLLHTRGYPISKH